MRRLERGAGRRRDRRTGPCSGSRRPAIPGLGWSGARGRGSHPRTRAASGLRPEVQRPPARSWLTAARKRAAESAARRRSENAAAGRREARRPPSLAGHLRRSGDGSARETDHWVRRFRTSACRRSAPLIFSGAEEDKGYPPLSNGRRSVGCLTVESEDRENARASGKLGALPSRPRSGGEGSGVGGFSNEANAPHPNPPRRALRARGEGTDRARGSPSANKPTALPRPMPAR